MKSLYESILDNEEEIMNKAADDVITEYYTSLFWSTPKYPAKVVVDNKKKVVKSDRALNIDKLGCIGQYTGGSTPSKTYKWDEFNKFGYKFKCDLIIDPTAIKHGVRLKDIDIEPKSVSFSTSNNSLSSRDLQSFIGGTNPKNIRLVVDCEWNTNLLETPGLSVFDEVELDISPLQSSHYLPVLTTQACDAKKVLIESAQYMFNTRESFLNKYLRSLNSYSYSYPSNRIEAEGLIKKFIRNNPGTKLGLSFGATVDYVQLDSDGSLKIQNMSKAQWRKL